MLQQRCSWCCSNVNFWRQVFFELRCNNNGDFWRQVFFDLRCNNNRQKETSIYERQTNWQNKSSSRRGIFTKYYAKEHLPLDRGITTGTLQFHKTTISENFSTAVQYKKNSLVLRYCVLQKDFQSIFFYTVVSAFYSAGKGHHRFNLLMKSLLLMINRFDLLLYFFSRWWWNLWLINATSARGWFFSLSAVLLINMVVEK